jgi:oxygen-dependent protoporphyrinogen oxidase
VTRPSIAIIGGGISGLAAAYELAQRGVPFVLYERARRLGGVVLTERVDGYTIDAGPDALLTQKPAAIDLCGALGLAQHLRPQETRATFVVRRGRLRQLPEASVLGIPTRWLPFVTTGAFSLTGKLRMAADAFLPARTVDSDESIASFIGRRFGREAVDYLAEPLLAGIHGGDPAQLSMQSAFPRFLELEARYGSVIVGLQRSATASAARGGAGRVSPFVALSGGMSELPDALAASLPAETLRPGIAVMEIDPIGQGRSAGGAGFELRLGNGERVSVPAILVAAPPRAAGMLMMGVDTGLAALCSRIRTSSVATVALAFARSAVDHPLQGTGFVVPRREGLAVRAISWVSSKWHHRAPAGKVLLRAFFGGTLDPGAIDLDDGALISAAVGDASRLLGIHGDPELARVYRWRHATPQLEVGHLDLMAAIERRAGTHSGLFLTGTGFRGTGLADCVEDGRRQAALAAGYVSDLSVSGSPEGPEGIAVVQPLRPAAPGRAEGPHYLRRDFFHRP